MRYSLVFKSFIKITTVTSIIVIVCSITECQMLKNDVKDLVVFDLTQTNKLRDIKLSDIGQIEIQYVPLKTDSNTLISRIEKIKSTDSSFFIFDSKSRILQFNFNGSFINQIGAKGKGPGEYIALSDFTIDNKNKQIFARPFTSESIIHVYSFNGKWLKNIPCPPNTRKIFYSSEGMLVCWSDNLAGQCRSKYNIFLMNNDGTVIKQFNDKYKYTNTKFPNGFLEEFYVYDFNKTTFVKELYCDTVFILKKKSFSPGFVLNHGGKTISKSAREGIISFDKFLETSFNYSKETKIFQFGDYVYSEFSYHKKYYWFIGSFKNSFSGMIKDGIINDIDNGPLIHLQGTIDSKTAIYWINAYELKAHVASEAFKNSTPKYPEKKKELEKLANSLHENDNPVLMLVKLKE